MGHSVKTGLRFRIDKLILETGLSSATETFKKHGISNKVLSDYCTNKRKSLNLHHVAAFITVFRCSVEDLFEWVPLDKNDDHAANPLQRFARSSTFNLNKEIEGKSYDELRKMFGKGD